MTNLKSVKLVMDNCMNNYEKEHQPVICCCFVKKLLGLLPPDILIRVSLKRTVLTPIKASMSYYRNIENARTCNLFTESEEDDTAWTYAFDLAKRLLDVTPDANSATFYFGIEAARHFSRQAARPITGFSGEKATSPTHGKQLSCVPRT